MIGAQKILKPTIWKVIIASALIFLFFMTAIYSSPKDPVQIAILYLIFPIVRLMTHGDGPLIVERGMLIPIAIYLYLVACIIYFVFTKIRVFFQREERNIG